MDNKTLHLTKNIVILNPNKCKSRILDLCKGVYPCVLEIDMPIVSKHGKNLIIFTNKQTGDKVSSHISITESVLSSIEYEEC